MFALVIAGGSQGHIAPHPVTAQTQRARGRLAVFVLTVKKGCQGNIAEAVQRIGQGKDSVKTYLMSNPDVADEVEAKVRENLMKASSIQPKAPAKAAERPVKVDADDFDDED